MLNAQRSLDLSIASAPELPRVPELEDLYSHGARPRQGEVVMIAGRSGTQKSGFALWWTSRMNLPTLYLSGDMSPYQASVRLACSATGFTTDEVEARMKAGGYRKGEIDQVLARIRMTLRYGAITWRGIDDELKAYTELHNMWPSVIVIDNLMDIEGCESDYTEQMGAMQEISAISRETGATVIVLHHATDKSWEAKTDPWRPPSRDQIKGGLAEKPELCLSVALDPTNYDYNIAIIKQRMGRSNPTGESYARLTAQPETTQFHKKVYHHRSEAPTAFTVGQ